MSIDSFQDRFARWSDILGSNPTLDNLPDLSNHLNGDWNNPWVGCISYVSPIAPDANNAVTLCERELYYALSYSGRIYYSYGTDKIWREIKYATSSDLTNVNNSINSINGSINTINGSISNINNSINTINSKLSSHIIISAITVNNVSLQSGETDIHVPISAIDNFMPIGIIGFDYADLRHVYLTQFLIETNLSNYSGTAKIGLYSSKAVTENMSFNVLYVRRDGSSFRYVTSSYTIDDNK